jgi:formylglycine-generating enzyme required for sulfatase activity
MAAPPSTATYLQLLRWRSRTQVFVERAEGLELPMVRIPAGSFVMGSPEGEPERMGREGPQHQVELGEFLMGRTPITQEQWRAVALWQPPEGERWERKLEPHPSRFGSWEGSNPINRIFLSTSRELSRSYVRAAEQAISMVGNVQADSDWPGDVRSRPLELIAELLGRCQLFVGLYGPSFSAGLGDRPGISAMEQEFDLATEKGLPRLIFVLDTNAPDANPGDGERQQAFLQRIAASGLPLQGFRTPDQLAALLVEALRPYGAKGHPDRLLPVERVSWEDAMEFCRRLSQRTGRHYTLPSEAQWEYACRGGTSTPFAFGETLSDELANYDASETYGNGLKGKNRKQTTPVGMFPANAWGLQDMHGNVWEWCLDDWHESYEGAPVNGSAWVDGAEGQSSKREGGRRLLRGGAWSSDPGYCRSAFRYLFQPGNADSIIGFRVVCLPQGPSLNA